MLLGEGLVVEDLEERPQDDHVEVYRGVDLDLQAEGTAALLLAALLRQLLLLVHQHQLLVVLQQDQLVVVQLQLPLDRVVLPLLDQLRPQLQEVRTRAPLLQAFYQVLWRLVGPAAAHYHAVPEIVDCSQSANDPHYVVS